MKGACSRCTPWFWQGCAILSTKLQCKASPSSKEGCRGAAPSLPSFTSPHTTGTVSWRDGGLCFWTTAPGLVKPLTRCISIRLGPLLDPPIARCRAWKSARRSTLSSTTPSRNQTLYLQREGQNWDDFLFTFFFFLEYQSFNLVISLENSVINNILTSSIKFLCLTW